MSYGNLDGLKSKKTLYNKEGSKNDSTLEDEFFCNNENLSIVEEFDELMRFSEIQVVDDIETRFLEFVKQTQELNHKLCFCQNECQMLRQELDKRIQDYNDVESKLTYARKLLDQERKRCRKLEGKVSYIEDLLIKRKKNHISNEELIQQLANLNPTNNQEINKHSQLNMFEELNTTSFLLSDFSYSCSENDFDVSALQSKGWKRHRPSMELSEQVALENRRSTDSKIVEINSDNISVRATTSLIVGKGGSFTVTSAIHSVPPESKVPFEEAFKDIFLSIPPKNSANNIYESNNSENFNVLKQRQHTFQAKTTVLPEICNVCKKRIGFAKVGYKCKDCRNLCHTECIDHVPLPCIPSANIPTQKHLQISIADYVPSISPMVPPLIVHCIKEIEVRGLNQIGIYRTPGSQKEIKALKEKFLKGKGKPYLADVNVNVLCGTIKIFLRSLSEPIITYARWSDFSKAVEIKKKINIDTILYQIISELPEPNQDTLAYVILHLKKVAASPECKMPMENLAKVFSPTVIGHSSPYTSSLSLMDETTKQYDIMMNLLNLPNDYWKSFVNSYEPEN